MVMGRKCVLSTRAIVNVFDDGLGKRRHPNSRRSRPNSSNKIATGVLPCEWRDWLHHFTIKVDRCPDTSGHQQLRDSGINCIKDWQLGSLRWNIKISLGQESQ